uniref:Uncharacterized protein n=1 Tax=Pipistrellus kuhlii TaxID=59472 RepID=A0A7J7RT33_PIPKU|nr:hypothetical protein mPipKuh1_010368 [Pipistrellus kuhlii]
MGVQEFTCAGEHAPGPLPVCTPGPCVLEPAVVLASGGSLRPTGFPRTRGPCPRPCVSVAAREMCLPSGSTLFSCVPAASGPKDRARQDSRLGSEGVSEGCVSCVQASFTGKTLVKGRWWVPSGSHPVPPLLLPLPSLRPFLGVICPEAAQRGTPSTSHPWTRTCPAPRLVTWCACEAGRVHGAGRRPGPELPRVCCLVSSASGCCFCPRWPSPGCLSGSRSEDGDLSFRMQGFLNSRFQP